MNILSLFLLVALVVFSIGLLVRRFDEGPMPSFLSFIVDSKWRKRIHPVKKIIEISGMKKGMTVLDLGCGPGTYTLSFARTVGGKGKVCVIDIQSKMLDKLRKKLDQPENKSIQNIEMKVSDAYKLPFPDKFFDVVCVVSVLPEVPNRIRALKEIRRVLKDTGTLAISETIFDPDYPLKGTTRKWCNASGFKLEESWSNFFSYTFQFKKD